MRALPLTTLLLLLCGACGTRVPTASTASPASPGTEGDYVVAPFDSLDVLAVNDWWNRPPNEIIDLKVSRDSVIAFGAYTVANGTLKLSAQLFPLYPAESREVTLAFLRGGTWVEHATQAVSEPGWMTTFRVDDWTAGRNVPYRLSASGGSTYRGSIRALPAGDAPLRVAAMSCNSSFDTGGRETYVSNVNHLDPDLVFFAGDQSYFHKNHTAGWLLFGMQFRDIFRDRPMVALTDDHDIGQPNLWGERGAVASRPQGDDGGYFYHPAYVNMVERAQMGHLPDPVAPGPYGPVGVTAYHTSYPLGPVSFAIIEDRKFKTGPKGMVPQQGPRPDHIQDPNYDPASVDLPTLDLLGAEQLAFLRDWAEARPAGTTMRAVLSQTGFCNAAHVHGTPDNRLLADMDSNGWPQTKRDDALRILEEADAVHVAGDQHLATVVQHGIDDFRDGPYAFVVPAVVNNYYSRWWWPADEQPGGAAAGIATAPRDMPWVGDYFDGFRNRITMHAYANPDRQDNGAGFGMVEFRPADGTVTFHCYPRTVDLTRGSTAKEFPGWPITVRP